MSLCFRSFRETVDDDDGYYRNFDAADHYNRGYYDGQEDARKEHEADLYRTYRAGFRAGYNKAIEALMKNLFDLFGDKIDLAYLDIKKETCSKEEMEDAGIDETSLESSLEDSLEKSFPDDSLDDIPGVFDVEQTLDDNQ